MSAQRAHEAMMGSLRVLDLAPPAVKLSEALRKAASPVQQTEAGGLSLSQALVLAAGLVKGDGFHSEDDALRAVKSARNIMPGGLADTDLVVPQLLTMPEVFSAGTGAFLLLAMVAAAMSSLDSVLLVMASTTQRDLVGMWREPASERATLRTTRFYVALFALITAVIALNPPAGIVGLTAFSGAVYGACFAPALLMGLYWRRGSGRAAVASFVTGLAVLLLWNRLPGTGGVHQVFPSVALSFLAYWLVARYTQSYPSDELDRLFEAERAGTAG